MIRYLMLSLAVMLISCNSPEAQRSQGGGPGADIGNRGAGVRMHEGSNPYAHTPRLIGGEPAPIESAHQARDQSTR